MIKIDKKMSEQLDRIEAKLDELLDLFRRSSHRYELVYAAHTYDKLHHVTIVKETNGFRGDLTVSGSEIEGVVASLNPHVNRLSYTDYGDDKYYLTIHTKHLWQVFKVAYLMKWTVSHMLVNTNTDEEITDPAKIYSILKQNPDILRIEA